MNPDFLWGGAVAKVPSGLAYDGFTGPRKAPEVDFLRLYKEQIPMLAELGMKALRVPVLWESIFPQGEGEADQEGLALYEDIVIELLRHGMEPIFCLYQNDAPPALLAKYGGWYRREMLDAYLHYARTMLERFAGRIHCYIPIANVNIAHKIEIAQEGSLIGREADVFQAEFHMLLANAHVVRMARELAPESMVAGMVNYVTFYPDSSHPSDSLTSVQTAGNYAMRALEVLMRGAYPRWQLNFWQKDQLAPLMQEGDLDTLRDNPADCLAFGYYMSSTISRKDVVDDIAMEDMLRYGTPRDPFVDSEPFEWSVDATGLRMAMNLLYNRFQKPLFLVESGVGVMEEPNLGGLVRDEHRVDYLTAHLRALRDAMVEDGVPCLGFLSWSPIDHLSADSVGSHKRYGLIYAQEEGDHVLYIPKVSCTWFADVIASGGMIG